MVFAHATVSVKTPAPLARMTWKPDEIARFTPEQAKYCEDLFKNAQNDGPFAPVRITDTVVFPGPDGGFNWGGGSFDPKLGYYFINSHDRGAVQKMVAQVPAAERPNGKDLAGDASQMPFVRQERGRDDQSGDGLACQSPPWGELFAINVNTGEVAWRVPFGRVDSLEKIGVMNTGSANIGGSVATGERLAVHWRHRRSALPRLRIEDREVAMGNEAARERFRQSHHLAWQGRKAVRRDHRAGDNRRIPPPVRRSVSAALLFETPHFPGSLAIARLSQRSPERFDAKAERCPAWRRSR